MATDLNVLALRDQPLSLADTLAKLAYAPVPESRNFQFVKPIPSSKETMRIEFMAPEEFKRHNDIRVDIQRGVHAATGPLFASPWLLPPLRQEQVALLPSVVF